MKLKAGIFVLFAAAFAVAHADDFKTDDGHLHSGKVSRVEPDGIVVVSDSGIEKLPFASLPKDVQLKYHFDPSKGKAFTAAIQAAAYQRQVSAEGGAPDTSGPQEVVFAAKDLASDYEANEVAADGKYKNKIFIASGTMTDFGTDILGHPYVILDQNVQCTFAEKDADAVGKNRRVRKPQ